MTLNYEQPLPLECQFSIGFKPSPKSQGEELKLDSVVISLFPNVKIARVVDQHGAQIGAIIGTSIDVDAVQTVRGTLTINSDGDVDDMVEREIYRLSGSFIFVLDYQGKKRVYIDPNGTKSLVFDPKLGLAGSTVQVMFDDSEYHDRLDWDLYRTLRILDGGWFPMGTTAHRGVDRLICNHYLDLDSWKPVRHWPRGPLKVDDNLQSHVHTMSHAVSNAVEALAKERPTHVALTAGFDSRVVASTCQRLKDKVDFYTLAWPGGELDSYTAERISRHVGFKYFTLPEVRASEDQQKAWDYRVGHSLAGGNRYQHPSMRPFFDHFNVGGLGGEMARGVLWKGARADARFTAREIVDRLKLPRLPDLERRAQNWLDELPSDDVLLMLDLLFLELRVCSWGHALSYANPRMESHHPMIARRNLTAMFTLAHEMRRENKLLLGIIEANCPEMLEIPVNKYGDYRDHFERVKLAMRSPGRALVKARQMIRTGITS